MDFSKLNTNALREMLKLSERKETLLNELTKLEEQIVSYLTGDIPPVTRGLEATVKKAPSTSKTPKTGKRAARGSMKQNVLEALTAAGPAGLKVPELAQKIGAKNANLHVWFSNTGKKLPEIERIGAGHFRIRQNS